MDFGSRSKVFKNGEMKVKVVDLGRSSVMERHMHTKLAWMIKRRVEFLNLITVPKSKLTIINPIITYFYSIYGRSYNRTHSPS